LRRYLKTHNYFKESMNKSLLFRIVVIVIAFVGSFGSVKAQVTTSTLVGLVKDATSGLPGASVKAIHGPTGTVYSVMTNTDGRYTIPNMRSGGPYTVEISYVGLRAEKFENVYLRLGDSFVLNASLNDNNKTLEEVRIVSKRDATFNSKHTGASTNISREQLQNLPSLSRSLQDFTRLTPQANGNSFGGASNKFNNISIDGAVNNDVFGLTSTGTPGGQASTQPISLDAIQEIQVVVTPFDVTNGNSTGGTVNAVTRSGTNKVEGSAYFFGRNQNSIGKSVDGLNTKAADFYNTTSGFRLGAPIVKNKLFIFVNGELGRIKTPTTLSAGEQGSVISTSDAELIANTAQTRYGYNVGSFGQFDQQTNSDKLFARVDWNINAKNQLTIRHNYISAFDDKITRSNSAFAFSNNGYRFTDVQNNTVLELRSAINQDLSNNLILGYSRIRDRRAFNGALFPQVKINNFNGSPSQSVVFGSEASSTANELDQDIFEFTDNFKILAGKHTFTVGTHNEFFKFRNLFMNNFAGSYTYTNLNDFLNNAKPNIATSTYSIEPGNNRPAAAFKAAQLGFYFQDEIEAFQGFRLIAGLRADVPMFYDNPPANPLVAATYPNQRTDQTPSGQILVSPRLSFNWDLTGDRTIQLRGGGALLTSRAPFVWLSNAFTNNGMLTAQVNATNGTGTFIADPSNQKAAGGVVGTTYEVNLTDNKLRLPQVFKTDLALDFKLPGGVFATLEGIYAKTVNNILYRNLNLRPSVATINPALTNGADSRPLFAYPTPAGKVSTSFTNAYILENTNRGETYSLTAQVSKAFDFGLSVSGAYTYGKSTDVNSGASSTAGSNYGFVQIVNNPNDPELSYSNYDLRHRIVGSLNYVARYGKNKASATTFSLFYAGKSGSPYTYLYFGDLNQDGNNQNDLLFVPRTINDIRLTSLTSGTGANQIVITPAQQWDALNAFIQNDKYLNSRRGKYAERNGARMPWEHQFDVRIMQDLGTMFKGSKNALQISLDVINVGNLINKDWGRSYFVTNNASTLVNYTYNATTGGGYTFKAPADNLAYQVSAFASRWQAQVGVRYLFN
jgi:hypothetical protein